MWQQWQDLLLQRFGRDWKNQNIKTWGLSHYHVLLQFKHFIFSQDEFGRNTDETALLYIVLGIESIFSSS